MQSNQQDVTSSIRNLIDQLHYFSNLDPKMQVSTILTLLEVARAEAGGEDISTQDIETRVGLHSGTASRNVYYWADGASGITGAHEMVSIRMHKEDRRMRQLGLTPKGKQFIHQVATRGA